MRLVLFVLLFSTLSYARERAWFWCEQGAQVITVLGYQSSPTTPVQRSYPSCTVTVYQTGSGGKLAKLYSDNAGTPLANPFVAQTNGYAFFYADNGRYDAQLSGAGIPSPFTLGDILLYDPAGVGSTYLWSHFRDDDQVHTYLSMSSDGLNWRDLNKQGSFATTPPNSIRDPSITFSQIDQKFYFVTSPGTASTSIQLYSTADLINFSTITLINVQSFVPGATAIFAPEFWHDPNTNLDYIWMPISTASNPFDLHTPFTMYLGQINLQTLSFVGTPRPVTVNGTTQSRIFDPFPYFLGGRYYLFYVDQLPTGDGQTDQVNQPIAYATSNDLLGPYTQQTTPGTDYFGWGDFQTEAPTLITLGNGCVRVIVDHWVIQQLGPGTSGRQYFPLFKDSCPSLGTLFSTASLVPSQSSAPSSPHISQSEHGTIIAISPTSSAYQVVQNALTYTATDSNYNSRLGVNTTTPFYSLSVKTKAAPPGFIQNNEAVSIGLDTGDGTYAQLSGCGINAGGCSLQFPGLNAFTNNFSGTSDYGQLQLSNSNTNAQASGVMLSNGVNQFGRLPTSASPNGQKAVWVMTENNKAMSNPGSDWFSFFNAGISSVNMVTAQTLGTAINATSGCYGYQMTVGGSPIKVVGLGRWVQAGNIGNHRLSIMNASGAIVAQYILDASTQYGVVGHYTYMPITPAFTLNASTTYYIMSAEYAGSDKWYDGTTAITPTAVATIGQPAYQASCGVGVPTLSGSSGHGFGPLDVLYSANSNGAVGGFPLSMSPQTGEVHVPVSVTFGSGLATLYGQDKYANIDALGSLGSTNRVNIGQGTPGDSSTTVVTGAIDVSNYIGNRGGVNTDLAGFLVLDSSNPGGAGTGQVQRTFVNAAAATSNCTAVDADAIAPVRVFVTGTFPSAVMNIWGTAAHHVNYMCIGHEF